MSNPIDDQLISDALVKVVSDHLECDPEELEHLNEALFLTVKGLLLQMQHLNTEKLKKLEAKIKAKSKADSKSKSKSKSKSSTGEKRGANPYAKWVSVTSLFKDETREANKEIADFEVVITPRDDGKKGAERYKEHKDRLPAEGQKVTLAQLYDNVTAILAKDGDESKVNVMTRASLMRALIKEEDILQAVSMAES